MKLCIAERIVFPAVIVSVDQQWFRRYLPYRKFSGDNAWTPRLANSIRAIFAAYEGQTLIAVTLYRKGAEEVTARLTEKDRRIAELESQLAGVRQQIAAPPAPPSTEPAPAWRPLEQLALIAAEDMRAYRTASPHRRPASPTRRS